MGVLSILDSFYVFGGVLGLFGVVCDDLAFGLRMGFPCVAPVCSPVLSLVLRLLSWQLWGVFVSLFYQNCFL